MRLFIAYHLPTNVLAVILAASFGEAWGQLLENEPDLVINNWRMEDYGDIIQASNQPTYFDLAQILTKGWQQ